MRANTIPMRSSKGCLEGSVKTRYSDGPFVVVVVVVLILKEIEVYRKRIDKQGEK